MIAEQAAFTYALLCTPTALYPRSLFQDYFLLTNDPFSQDTRGRILDGLALYKERERSARGQKKAFFQLLVRDGEKALAFLDTYDLAPFDLMDTIKAYYQVAEEYYHHHLKLEWNYSPPVVVDTYPEPASQADWFAVSHVPGGPRPGYPEGIYFLRRHMMPAVAELATLHENTHHLGTGSKGAGGYYRYFDEGCANFLAYLTYFHRNRDLAAIQIYRTFLQEINPELYEHPSFDRIMATLVFQIGVTGLYRMLVRRLTKPESIDWKEVLLATAASRMSIERREDELDDNELPEMVHELQEGADKIIAQILYPERVVMSPIAYLAYDHMSTHGAIQVGKLQSKWSLSEAEVDSVIKEVENMDLWIRSGNAIKPSGRSDLFHMTGVIRAHAIEVLGNNR